MPAPPVPAASGSTIPGQSNWVTSGLGFLNSGSAALTQSMNSIGSLLANAFSFGDQVKDITQGNSNTYTPVGASAGGGSAAPVNPIIGGIPVLPIALGGIVVLGFVLLLRK